MIPSTIERMGRVRLVLSLLPFVTAWLPAQAFVVDAANGPGANYTSIAAAVTAVPDNSVLFVRPGNYDGFTIQAKGLTVLGGAGVGVTGPVSVHSTSQIQSVVLRGLTINSLVLCYNTPVTITVNNCSGPVLLEELTTPAGFLFGRCVGTPLSVLNSSQVVVRECGLAGRTEVDSSTIVFDGGDLFGWIADGPAVVDSSGLLLTNSNAQIVGADVRGGDGFQASTAGSPGIEMQDSNIRLLPGASVAAGAGAIIPASATIVANGTNQLRADPSVPLSGAGAQAQGVTVQTSPMPAVHATSGTAGGSVGATVSTQIGDLVILVVGLRGAPSQIPGFADEFWLVPGSYSFFVIAVQTSALNPVAGSISVPAGTSFEGLQLGWHAVSSGAVTGFQNSNPGISLIY